VKLELTLGESTSSLSGEFWRASCEAFTKLQAKLITKLQVKIKLASGEAYHKASG